MNATSNNWKHTPLMAAAYRRHTESVNLLLQHSDRYARDISGNEDRYHYE